ncbi:hypothetical protein Tco_1270493, partial [Tanacetum coccineum]
MVSIATVHHTPLLGKDSPSDLARHRESLHLCRLHYQSRT